MIELEIINFRMKKWIKIGYLFVIPLIIVLIIYLLFKCNFEYIVLFKNKEYYSYIFVVLVLCTFQYILYNLNVKIIEIIGIIRFDKEEILISKNNSVERLQYLNIKQIKIKILGYAGQQVSGGGSPKTGFFGETTSDGYNQLEGYENKILMKTIDGKNHQYNFYIGSQIDSEKLKNVLKDWDKDVDLRLEIIR